ncbi:MAG: T9SS type A sorting domain-containing protein [Bacteroidota bacterium]
MGINYISLTCIIFGLFAFGSLNAQTGSTCADPFEIQSIPFHQLNASTEGFGDDYSTSPCDANYITGNDYVLSLTPATSEYVTIRLENADAWTGLHLLDNCPDANPTCVGADNQSSAGVREIVDVKLEANTTYYIIVSSFAAPQSVDFDLHILAGTPPAAGTSCSNPKQIGSLPFLDRGINTGDFGNLHSGTGPCAAENENYLNGNEIVYEYIPSANEAVTLEVSQLSGFFAGLQLLDACPEDNPNCLASDFNTTQTSDLILENILLEKGTAYYIILSTWENPPSISFDLSLTSIRSCSDPTDFSIDQLTQTSASINWAGDATNWNIQLLPRGASPGAIGSKVTERPFQLNNLTANTLYDLYIQSNCKAASLMITGLYDGPLSGGNPKGVELYVLNDIADLSDYGIGSANNGEGTDGIEYTFPAISVTSGTHLYWASDGPLFNQFFGFDPDFVSPDALVNGDDAVELFHNSQVIDVFGYIDIDGTGQTWEYKDGWAYRRPGQEANDGFFDPEKWFYSGIDNLEGNSTNATCDVPFPVGTFEPPATLTSDWAGPFTFNTLPEEAACGGMFLDNGGTYANYTSNQQDTFTICPDQLGFVVKVEFQSFDVEAGDGFCLDGLTIYDGENTEAAIIPPNNDQAAWCWNSEENSPVGTGDLAGRTIASTGPSGCLTFVFESDDSGNGSGWSGNVICTAEQDCSAPDELMVSSVASSSAVLSWMTQADRAVDVDIAWGEKGITPQTGNLVKNVSAPYTLEGLEPSTIYAYYVKQNCGAFGSSEWAGPFNFISACSSSVGDEIENAIRVDAFPFVSSGSTVECYSNTFGHPSSDAFYEFSTDDCMTSVTISSCSELTDFDTVIRLLDSLGNEVDFNDDAVEADCSEQLDAFNRLSVLYARVNPNTKYFVMIEGFGPNEGIFEIAIEEGILPAFEIESSAQAASCYGETDGQIDLEIIGGAGSVDVQWNTGQSGVAISDLAASIYTATITDACGSSQEISVEVEQPDAIQLGVEVVHESSVGKANGSISMQINGGELPYTYEWSNGALSKNLINLVGGEYCVTVTDQMGCTVSECVTINSGLVYVRELDELKFIELQPNPASEASRFRLEFEEAVDLEISVLNSLGQLVWKITDENVQKKDYRLDVRNFSNGIYFIQLNYKNYVVSHKLVVER